MRRPWWGRWRRRARHIRTAPAVAAGPDEGMAAATRARREAERRLRDAYARQPEVIRSAERWRAIRANGFVRDIETALRRQP